MGFNYIGPENEWVAASVCRPRPTQTNRLVLGTWVCFETSLHPSPSPCLTLRLRFKAQPPPRPDESHRSSNPVSRVLDRPALGMSFVSVRTDYQHLLDRLFSQSTISFSPLG